MPNQVRIYWNLHKKCWSVQDRKTGRVINHAETLTLLNAKFVVRKSGQEKVRREGKKNVHAFAVGTTVPEKEQISQWVWRQYEDFGGRLVTYNPYVNDTFVFADTGEPVTEVQTISVYTENDRPKVYAIPKSNIGLTSTTNTLTN